MTNKMSFFDVLALKSTATRTAIGDNAVFSCLADISSLATDCHRACSTHELRATDFQYREQKINRNEISALIFGCEQHT